MMQLKLVEVKNVFGIYGPNKELMPTRACWLHPDAAESFNAMNVELRVRVSDMLRSADSSLAAVKAGRGAQMPSYSGHNYGFSIDIDHDWMMREHKLTKRALDFWMENKGWYCFRKDHQLAAECWHYNFFGEEADKYVKTLEGTNQNSLERKIVAYYGDAFLLEVRECQDALGRLGVYSGAVDGDVGGLTRSATGAFQRAWKLDTWAKSQGEYLHEQLGSVTCRLLSFIEGERVRLGAIKPSAL